MPFLTTYVLAFCGECEWGERVETPTPGEQARLLRHMHAHRRDTGHEPVAERAQTYFEERAR